MVFKLVKMFSYLFLSIIVLIFLACLWRLVNGKDAFISIRYLLDYFNFFNGIEEINNIQGSIESAISSITNTITTLPSFEGVDFWADVLSLLKYLGNLLTIPIEIVVYAVFIIKDLLIALLDVITWVFGFIDYVLAY